MAAKKASILKRIVSVTPKQIVDAPYNAVKDTARLGAKLTGLAANGAGKTAKALGAAYVGPKPTVAPIPMGPPGAAQPADWYAPMAPRRVVAQPAPLPDYSGNHSPAFNPKTMTGEVGPQPVEAPQTDLEKLSALLPQLNLKDYLAPYKKDDYTQPYDDASGIARGAADAALTGPNSIKDIYANLRGSMDTGAADLQGQLAKNRAQTVTDSDALKAALAQRMQSTQQGFAAQGVSDPSLLGGYGAALQDRAASADQSAASRLALQDRFSQIAGQEEAARKQDSYGAEGAATSNIQSELLHQLTGLGMDRAKATQDYNRDTAGATRDFNTDSRARAMQLFSAHQKQAETDSKLAADRMKLLKDNAVTPSQQFANDYGKIAQATPKAVQVFEDLLSRVKGKGEMGRVQAERILDQWAPTLKAGQFEFEDKKGNKTPVGARINPAVLKGWLAQHFDDTTKVLPPDVMRLLSGV